MRQAGTFEDLVETVLVTVQLEVGENDGHDVDALAHIKYFDAEGNNIGYETLFVQIPAHTLTEAIDHINERLRAVGLTVEWAEASEQDEAPRDLYEFNEFPVARLSS